MTCAKREVTCILEPPIYLNRSVGSGRVLQIVGTNGGAFPQKECPRAPGDGYAKCKTICGQRDHAEMDALRLAGELGVDLKGWHATVFGHNYCCPDCGNALVAAGITEIRVIPTPYKQIIQMG